MIDYKANATSRTHNFVQRPRSILVSGISECFDLVEVSCSGSLLPGFYTNKMPLR